MACVIRQVMLRDVDGCKHIGIILDLCLRVCLLPLLDIYIFSILNALWHAITLQFDPCPRKKIKVQQCLCTSGRHKGVEVYLGSRCRCSVSRVCRLFRVRNPVPVE